MLQIRSLILLAASTLSFAFPLTSAVRRESINDPNLKMAAFNVTIPSNWKFDGAYLPGTSCSQIPFPVFRAYSPDGLTEVRRYPRFDWSWSDAKFKGPSHPDCLSLTQEIPAHDFIKYVMGVLQVAYVRDAPVPRQMVEARQKQIEEANAHSAANAVLPSQRSVQSYDFAAVFAEYRNGSFTIEEHIQVGVTCIKSQFYGTCNANVSVARAPKGQLAGVLAMVESEHVGAAANADWAARYMQAFTARTNAMAAQRQRDFDRAQAVRAQQHQQFLANLQAGTDRSMARAREIANSNHTIASDWCDYVLDQQTVTGAGGTVKISNAYNHTWSDGSGHYYQTNNPNADPNGTLPGNWAPNRGYTETALPELINSSASSVV